MDIDQTPLGFVFLILSLLATYHWYNAHLVNGMLVPELGISITLSIILSLGIITKKVRIK